MRYLLATALTLALAACGQPSNAYPETYETNFVQACQMNGSTSAHCLCVWGKVEAEIPVSEFVAADAALQAGGEHPIRQQILGFHEACRVTP